jgi:hypothetical protein
MRGARQRPSLKPTASYEMTDGRSIQPSQVADFITCRRFVGRGGCGGGPGPDGDRFRFDGSAVATEPTDSIASDE